MVVGAKGKRKGKGREREIQRAREGVFVAAAIRNALAFMRLVDEKRGIFAFFTFCRHIHSGTRRLARKHARGFSGCVQTDSGEGFSS